jgi:ribosomal protein S18 acetylase RimI-like enzyme
VNVSDVCVREAVRAELPAVLAVQHDAFSRVAKALGIEPSDLPPLQETLGQLEDLRLAGTRFFVAADPLGRIVGSVRASERDVVVDIGRLVVASDRLRQGIATRLVETLEASYAQADRFVLFTGEDATEALALYTKLGYELTRRDATGPVVLVWLEKRNPRATA